MANAARPSPPFCPNPSCPFHQQGRPGWRYTSDGVHRRKRAPFWVRRYRCSRCGRRFCDQTFRTTYWLKRPDIQARVFVGLVACSGQRQLARSLGVAHGTVATHSSRLGRHCLLLHERTRPRGRLTEPICLDGFHSVEWSRYHPVAYHVVVGLHSHYFYGFTDSELRRSGSMSDSQKQLRAHFEARLGRPDPRSVEKQVAAVLRTVVQTPQPFALHTDQHEDYPRAISRLPQHKVAHSTISSRALRDRNNPLFPVNLLDLLLRHSQADHRRATLSFPKRRQGTIERLWVFLVWRNLHKWDSENRPGRTPAMHLGLERSRASIRRILQQRQFPSHGLLSPSWWGYYWRVTPTRRMREIRVHDPKYTR